MTTHDATQWRRCRSARCAAAEWRRWRAGRNQDLAEPSGWLSLVSFEELGAEFAPLQHFPGLWRCADGVVEATFTMADRVSVNGNGIEGTGRIELDEDESDFSLRHDELVAEVAVRGGRHIVRVRDANAPTLIGFHGVPAFDHDPDWVLTGTFVPYAQTRTLQVRTSHQGLEQPIGFGGELTFTAAGRQYTFATMGDAASTEQLLSFHDATNGELTAQWRGLVVDVTDPTRVEVDFNRAFNFPSAFTAFGTCPQPLPEVVLEAPVTAGEQRPLPPAP